MEWNALPGRTAHVNGQTIYFGTAGAGPAVLLLHGHPQTSHIWRFIAPRLSETHRVVWADLRGYGRSSKPRGGDNHIEYSKREMAKDMLELMQHLGHDRFDILAHDRGARVAHRLVLDYPYAVSRMCLLDIAPTLYMYENANMMFAMGYWHWFFMPQPAPYPEEIMLADPDKFWNLLSRRQSHIGVEWTSEDVAEYKRYYFTPEGVHATCEDYRAAATVDLEHDRASQESNSKISIEKLKILWGARGIIAKYDDPLQIWKDHCDSGVQVEGGSMPCGHYIPESEPQKLLQELESFFE